MEPDQNRTTAMTYPGNEIPEEEIPPLEKSNDEKLGKAREMIEQAKELLAETKKLQVQDLDLSNIKKEIEEILDHQISDSEVSDDEGSQDPKSVGKLTEVLSTIKLSHVTKLRKYTKGENFARFCNRFLEYIQITRMRDSNLYMFFLQNVCDETYTILHSAVLSDREKKDAKLFCKIFKDIIYGEEKVSLQNEFIDCKQNVGETVMDYAYRLQEKADIAFVDPQTSKDSCFLAFLRGVRNPHIKRKLNEAQLDNFKDAIKMATKLERIEKMLNPQTDIASILKETSTVSFRPSRSEFPDQERSKNRSGSGHSWRSNSTDRSRSQSRSRSRDRSRNGDRLYFERSRSVRSYPNNGNNRRSYSNDRHRGRSDRRDSRSYNRNANKICYNCQKRGHLKFQCWSRRPQQSRDYRGQGPSSWSQHTVVGPANNFGQSNQAVPPLDGRSNVDHLN